MLLFQLTPSWALAIRGISESSEVGRKEKLSASDLHNSGQLLEVPSDPCGNCAVAATTDSGELLNTAVPLWHFHFCVWGTIHCLGCLLAQIEGKEHSH